MIMYTITIDNTIANQAFEGLQIKQLVKNTTFEVLSISLAKDAIFPPHESHKDAHLIMLQGQIVFYIENNPVNLMTQQEFSFPKHAEHWVEALENSKFIIIR